MKYFDEKSHQLSTSDIIAFGIPLSSRQSKAIEVSELLLFSHKLAKNNFHTMVKDVFYDSNSNCCFFKLSEKVTRGSLDEIGIFEIAKTSISQFEWFGAIYHGNVKYDD